MKRVLIFIILFISFNVYASTYNEDAVFSKCIDGDTAYFIVNDESVKVRFLSVDTPEVNKKDYYAQEAKDYTCQLLTNAKEIKLEIENGSSKDKYDRLLAWVWVDRELLQQKLISGGYAKVAYVYGNYKYSDKLCEYQNNAVIEKLGIWNNNNDIGYCTNPTDVINEIDYDLIGNDKIVYKPNESSLDKLQNDIDRIFDSESIVIVLASVVVICILVSNIFKKKEK